MRLIAIGTLGGLLVGSALAIIIVLVFSVTNSNVAFFVGVGCGLIGGYGGIYLVVHRS